ncbi:MAG: hypothetical protein IPH76_07270 [Xanthomonadales bacterium]|nr:hypothetical protein [Xanthomonadales bacterium]
MKYKRLPAVGPLATRAAGSLRTFLWEIPNLFYFGRVPSLQVVNAFLELGVADAGMSGGARWKPFAISSVEYDEVMVELRAAKPSHRGLPLVFSEVPSSVCSVEQWTSWALSDATGAPYEELLRLTLEEKRLSAENMDSAKHDDDESVAAHMRWYEAASALNKFLHPYLDAHAKRLGV